MVEAPIVDCMDPEASNYDETAWSTTDNYLRSVLMNETELQLTMIDSYGDGWNGSNGS